MTVSGSPHYLPRGIDYLGNLAAKLRDLRGYATLAHELIQNADDVDKVTSIAFDVADDGLIVTNDAAFTDCGAAETPDCLWKGDDRRGFLCDFHRFRSVASGDKRHQPETTGAFGIGFIAVYQITDAPELVSTSRHWRLHDDHSEAERIEVCPGCPRCRDPIASTVFYLPWARDASSTLRTAFNVEEVTDSSLRGLLDELRRSMPRAMLFLKRLNKIEIKRAGQILDRIERVRDGDSLILSDGGADSVWHMITGDFDSRAAELRREHGVRIEQKRSSHVALAIPAAPTTNGLLCATLPTQHETGLAFHVNADFFPTSDRKRVIFETDYQSQWNRAAITAAANAFSENLDWTAHQVGHCQLWATIDSVYRVATEAEGGRQDSCFKEFLEQLKPRLGIEAIIFTTNSEWCSAREAVLLYERRETESIPLLEHLGIAVVHDDLRPYHNRLRSADVGIPLLDVSHIANALEGLSLTKRMEVDALPSFLRSAEALPQLWREVSALLRRPRKSEEQLEQETRLKACAIALGTDGALWPCNELYRADSDTQAVFHQVSPSVSFVAAMGEDGAAVAELCRPFTAEVAVESLELVGGDTLRASFRAGRLQPSPVLRWFEHHRPLDPRTRRQLAALPLFPSSTELRPLDELALPGDFSDPIGLADLVDLAQVENRREFLRELGAEELTFENYVAEHLPRAFQDQDLSPEKKRPAVLLLAERLGELRDSPELKEGLSDIELVECDDGCFRRAADAYLPGQVVAEVLGDKAPKARLAGEHAESIRELYRWLGVAAGPRLSDIVARVDELIADPPNADSVPRIQAIFRHFGARAASSEHPLNLEALASRPWLPARGEYSRWYRPTELFAVFQAYLFESQAKFLDMPDVDQRKSTRLLELLGVKQKPQVAQVVNHLIEYASAGRIVNNEVYRFLNDNADAAPVERLRMIACLPITDTLYVKPTQVFWGEHPFGRLRHRLSQTLRKYNDLFTRLGVRETPDCDAALEVLHEVAESYGSSALDDDAYAALMACWCMVEKALDTEELTPAALAELRKRKVIPNAKHVLNPPDWVFFEDVPGLAAKFGSFLENNVIVRPPGAWRAMAMVGVQSLSGAVTANLAECDDPCRDEALEESIKERRGQLARVLDAHESGQAVNLGRLEDIRATVVQKLAVQYTLHAFNQDVSSNLEDVPAHYHRESGELFFVQQNGTPPWNSIARELALLLCPDVEPGRLAPGIKEVLAAGSCERARLALDELGCPGLADTPPPLAGHEGTVEDLAGEPAPDAVPPEAPPSAPGPPPPPASDPPAEAMAGREGDRPLTPDEALDTILGSDRSSPESLPDGLEKADAAVSSAGASGTRTGGRRQTAARRSDADTALDGARARSLSGGRLRTYVTHESCNDDHEPDTETYIQRSGVAQAGVDHVMAYERERGRSPKEMPPQHPGYDVESRCGENGKIVRYIEIKALSGKWGPFNAALTRTQFEKAEELGDRFWLYVVERAEQHDFRIFRIPNPARQVNQFIFDDGWNALAEADPDNPGCGKEED